MATVLGFTGKYLGRWSSSGKRNHAGENDVTYPTNEELRHAAQRALDWPEEDRCVFNYEDRKGEP